MRLRCLDPSTSTSAAVRAAAGGKRRSSFAEARARLHGQSVLIVDPDVENAGRAFMSLGQAGAEARLCRRWDQLATALGERRPDLVLVGARAPGEPVLDAVVDLRARLEPGVVLGALVGTKSSRERARLVESGCDLVLAKPVDVYLFAQVLVDALVELASRRPGP